MNGLNTPVKKADIIRQDFFKKAKFYTIFQNPTFNIKTQVKSKRTEKDTHANITKRNVESLYQFCVKLTSDQGELSDKERHDIMIKGSVQQRNSYKCVCI